MFINSELFQRMRRVVVLDMLWVVVLNMPGFGDHFKISNSIRDGHFPYKNRLAEQWKREPLPWTATAF